MRTIIENRKKVYPRQFVITKEKRDEFNNMLDDFYKQSKEIPTFHEFENYSENLYKSFLDDAIQNRPKLSQEKMYIFNKLSKIFKESLPIFVDKEDFIDVMYNVLLNTKNLPHSKISKEKINEIHIVLKNSIPHTAKEYIHTIFSKDPDHTGYEEYLEHICQKLLNVL